MTIDQFKQIIGMMGFEHYEWDSSTWHNCHSDLNVDAWVRFDSSQFVHDKVSSYYIDGNTVDFAHFYRWLMEHDEAERNHAEMVRAAGDEW